MTSELAKPDPSPLVSVIIPAYKARNYLSDSLGSVAAQDHPSLEVLVIDDCSPEPIDDLVAAYRGNAAAPELRVIRHETNQGLGAARNTGIREARGEFVALLDHDDVWEPGHVSTVLGAMHDAGADLGFCTVMEFNETPGETVALWGPPGDKLDANLPFQLFKANFITPSSVIARRPLLESLGGFNTDPKVHMCEDLDLWLRALETGAKFVHSPEPTVHYRKHPAAATSRKGYMDYQAAYVLDVNRHRVKGPWLEMQSIIATKWWQALVSLDKAGEFRADVLRRAVFAGIPVPWQIARGTLRLFRSKANAGRAKSGA